MHRRRAIILLGCLVFVVQVVYLVMVQALSNDDLGKLGPLLTVALCVVFALVDVSVIRYLFSALRNIERAQAASVDEQLKESLQGYREAVRVEEHAVRELAQELEAELARARLALGSQHAQAMDDHLCRSLAVASDMGSLPCENVTVAAVLEAKSRQCEKDGIVLKTQVSLPREISIPDMEIASVFFNLIDNARHECAALVSQGTQAPVIGVYGTLQSGQLYVEVANPCRTDAESRRRRARAAIDSSRQHGWGMGIVEDIARRHGGIATFGAKGDRFSAQVMIPLAASPVG